MESPRIEGAPSAGGHLRWSVLLRDPLLALIWGLVVVLGLCYVVPGALGARLVVLSETAANLLILPVLILLLRRAAVGGAAQNRRFWNLLALAVA
ncbi:MAG: hypothetical protein AAGN66_19220, partial [Acidobacteriota bacterium]